MRLLDVLTFWSAQCVFVAERWQHEFGPMIRGWLAAAGEFETLTALSGYSYEHADDVFPGLHFNSEVTAVIHAGELSLIDED